MVHPGPPSTGQRVAVAVSVVALAALGVAVPAGSAATVTLPSGMSTAEAAAEYEHRLQGGTEGPPQIVESACENRFGGRLCPQLAPGSDPAAALGDGAMVETSGRWFFVPPLPVADVPAGARLGGAEPDDAFESWLVRRSFVADGAARLESWRRQAADDALVDCTVDGCQAFAFAAAPDKPADEEWLVKCWVEVADGVRGAPYNCQQVAAVGGEEAWLRARMAWSEARLRATSRRPPFTAELTCGRPLATPARTVATALERPPLALAARALQRGDEIVAVAAPRTSPVLAAVAEWPSFRLRVVEARQGGPSGERWAYGLEIDHVLLTAPPGSGRDADWRPADAAAVASWKRRLRTAAVAALDGACGPPAP